MEHYGLNANRHDSKMEASGRLDLSRGDNKCIRELDKRIGAFILSHFGLTEEQTEKNN